MHTSGGTLHPLRSFALWAVALVVAVGLLAMQPSSAEPAAAPAPVDGDVASPATPAPAPVPSARSVEVDLLRLTNELRSARGLRPLAEDRPDLTAMARDWTTRMVADGAISHRPDLEAAGPSDWVRLGENVGVGHSARQLHDAFVASPAHLRNLVDPAFESMSVAAVVAPDGRIWVTQQFLTAGA
jgi:uncharacterized protein YkwD